MTSAVSSRVSTHAPAPLRGLCRPFTEHPASLGETYGQHFRVAMSYAIPLLGAALAAFAHAVFPFLFTTTASAAVKRLHDRMTKRCFACPSGRLHRPDLFLAEAVVPARAARRPTPL